MGTMNKLRDLHVHMYVAYLPCTDHLPYNKMKTHTKYAMNDGMQLCTLVVPCMPFSSYLYVDMMVRHPTNVHLADIS